MDQEDLIDDNGRNLGVIARLHCADDARHPGRNLQAGNQQADPQGSSARRRAHWSLAIYGCR